MKKLLTYFILIFLSFNINAEISRNSIDNIKQLSWSEIVDAVSETYQYGYVSAVNIDGLYFHPVEARYGKLSQKNLGEYKERVPAFKYGGFSIEEQSGNNLFWSIDKKNNQICYGGKYSKHDCVYLFYGLENNQKYLYFSNSKNGDFYERTTRILKFDSSKSINQPFKDLSWNYVFKNSNRINLNVYTSENTLLSKNKNQQDKVKWDNLSTEDKRVAEEKIAKDAGYITYAEMQNAKKIEEKRIAEEKKAEERRISYARKEKERLKNFKTLTMSCMYSINGRYLTYSWAYDGKKLYWEGIPINFGKNNIEQGMTTSLSKLPGKDRFNIKITGIGAMEFNNDFDSKNSEMDYVGMKAFGSCY